MPSWRQEHASAASYTRRLPLPAHSLQNSTPLRPPINEFTLRTGAPVLTVTTYSMSENMAALAALSAECIQSAWRCDMLAEPFIARST